MKTNPDPFEKIISRTESFSADIKKLQSIYNELNGKRNALVKKEIALQKEREELYSQSGKLESDFTFLLNSMFSFIQESVSFSNELYKRNQAEIQYRIQAEASQRELAEEAQKVLADAAERAKIEAELRTKAENAQKKLIEQANKVQSDIAKRMQNQLMQSPLGKDGSNPANYSGSNYTFEPQSSFAANPQSTLSNLTGDKEVADFSKNSFKNFKPQTSIPVSTRKKGDEKTAGPANLAEKSKSIKNLNQS